MPIARILRRFVPTASDLANEEITVFETEILAVLTALTVQQRQAVQVQFTSVVQPGGLWLLVSILSPI